MAKTKIELLREAAAIIQALAKRTDTDDHLGQLAEVWLAEEISDDEPAAAPSEEMPTDDRWFAAYLKGMEVVGRYLAPQVPTDWQEVSAIAKKLADNALAAAREQAKEMLAKPERTK